MNLIIKHQSRKTDVLLTILLLIVLWQGVVWVTKVPEYILPSPLDVLRAIQISHDLLWENMLVTANEIIVGLVFGTLLGVITGLLLVISSGARRFMMSMLILSQTIPIFAIAPLLTLWLGYGLASKITMTILVVYFPVTSTFYDGLMSTPVGYLNLAQTMQTSKLRSIFYIRLPAAIPSLASGIRLAAVYAPIGAIIGEWVGASKGLGYLMLLANGRVKTALMFAALFVLCLFAILLRYVLGLLCDKATRWCGEVVSN